MALIMSSTSKYHGWLKFAIYNGLQKISIPLFGVLSTMILAHKALSKPEMGVWSLFLAITAFVEVIRQSLVKTSLIKYINHSDNEKHKYVLSAAFFLNTVITLLLCIVLLTTASLMSKLLHAPELKSMIYMFIPGMLLLIPFSHFEWIMYGKSLFKNLMWIYLIRQGIALLLVIIFLIFFKLNISLDMLVIFFCIGILGGSVAGLIYVEKFVEKKVALSRSWIMQLWHFGKFVFGTGVSSLLFRNADQFLVSKILADTSLIASQSVSMRIINLADIPSQVLGDVLFPKTASTDNSKNPEKIKSYYEKTVGASLCFIVPVVIFILLFPKFILLILAGKDYLDAIPYLRLISITGIFLAFLKQFGTIIDSTGRPKTNFITISVMAVTQVILCYFFITYMGFLGAAYALLGTHLIGFIITQYLLNKYFKINYLSCFKNAFMLYPEIYQIITQRFSLKLKPR